MNENEIERVCCGCSKTKPRNELIKITKNKQTNEIKVNPNSDFFGRSVYVCKDETCVNTAFKKNRIFKMLKTKPDETLKEKICAVLES